MATRRLRLDCLMLKRGLTPTRTRAQAEIMAGRVLVNGRRCDKPGTRVSCEADIVLIEPDNPYVSRGGMKLAGALEKLSLSVQSLVVLDIGASTGGFTDCLLQRDAALVYALDVGYGQLHWRLRRDPRVVVMERFNVRQLKREHLSRQPHLATVDVSFISLKLVLPVLKEIPVSQVLALVKPQFEAGREAASRGKGVIRDPGLHRTLLKELIEFAAAEGYYCTGFTRSHPPGPRGNREFFVYWTRDTGAALLPEETDRLVDLVTAPGDDGQRPG